MERLQNPPSLADLAYEKLHQSILSGNLESGKIYQEMELAHQLGISRTPVREALLELAAQGLVTFIPRKGVRINQFSINDIGEVFELRSVLEIYIVDKLASQRSKFDFSSIEETIIQQENALRISDSHTFISAGRAFHAGLAHLTRNSLFISVQENLRDRLHVVAVEAHKNIDRMEDSINEHRFILDCVRKGLRSKARKAMKVHLEGNLKAVVCQCRQSESGDPQNLESMLSSESALIERSWP